MTLRKRPKTVGLRPLARAMGISAPYLLDLERGRRTVSREIKERHARALATFKKPSARST